MNFFSRFFKKSNKKNDVVKINIFGQDHLIDISEEALKNSKLKHDLQIEKAWEGENEIEMIRNDGVKIYKSNRVNSYERKQIGFFGLKWYSKNNNFCVVYLPHFEDEEFNLALVEVKTKSVLFRTKLMRPHRCRVTNNGTIVCEDWQGYDSPDCCIYILDIKGTIKRNINHSYGIGDIFEFIESESKFKYNINYTNEIFEIEIT